MLVNAAAGLMAGGLARTPGEAMAKAAEAVDSGRAMAVLEKLQKNLPNSEPVIGWITRIPVLGGTPTFGGTGGNRLVGRLG